MCLALLAKQGSRVSHRLIRRAWESNPDGAGLMFADGGELYIYRFMDSERSLWKAYQELLDGGKQICDVVMHFRYATHGACTEYNCHPFEVHPGLAMVHNGIINIKQEKGDRRSDTRAFAEDYLAKLSPDFHLDDGTCKVLEEVVGGTNKLIFLDELGRSRIVNESLGFWEGGVWFSNRSGHTVEKRYSWKEWDWSDWSKAADGRWYREFQKTSPSLPPWDEERVPCSWCDDMIYSDEMVPLCATCKEYTLGIDKEDDEPREVEVLQLQRGELDELMQEA